MLPRASQVLWQIDPVTSAQPMMPSLCCTTFSLGQRESPRCEGLPFHSPPCKPLPQGCHTRMLLSSHCPCEGETIPARRPVRGCLEHCRSRTSVMTWAPWPGPRRGGPWAAKRLSQPGRTAYLTLPGDTAGGNLDIVVKKYAAAASDGRVPSRARGYVLAPETGVFGVS